jgi:hypothetical protein
MAIIVSLPDPVSPRICLLARHGKILEYFELFELEVSLESLPSVQPLN